MLKVFEAFSGYGSQSIALERLGIEHKVVGISEIDKNAIKAYYALHSEDIPNFGDISKINPEDFIIKVSNLINDEKATVIIEHIQYNKLDDFCQRQTNKIAVANVNYYCYVLYQILLKQYVFAQNKVAVATKNRQKLFVFLKQFCLLFYTQVEFSCTTKIT